jgi:uncharacterized protein (DUF342 family)
MNSKQKRTLVAIFTDPISPSISWKDIESLLIALGAEVIEGRGSRVRFHKDGIIATFNRPHSRKEAKPYQVKDARIFLIQLGVES